MPWEVLYAGFEPGLCNGVRDASGGFCRRAVLDRIWRGSGRRRSGRRSRKEGQRGPQHDFWQARSADQGRSQGRRSERREAKPASGHCSTGVCIPGSRERGAFLRTGSFGAFSFRSLSFASSGQRNQTSHGSQGKETSSTGSARDQTGQARRSLQRSRSTSSAVTLGKSIDPGSAAARAAAAGA